MLGLGPTGGLAGADVFAPLEAFSCCASGLDWATADEVLRGLGGCGRTLEAGRVLKDADSFDGLLKATGFLGGAGADFVLAFDAPDERCLSLSA